jgi:multidrug efflux pump subunit AcrB
MAVIATTFALVAVFLPTAFMSGIPGLFFKQFGWTAVMPCWHRWWWRVC